MGFCNGVVEEAKKVRRTGANQLKTYSPWLSQFKGDRYLLKLEIPGMSLY